MQADLLPVEIVPPVVVVAPPPPVTIVPPPPPGMKPPLSEQVRQMLLAAFRTGDDAIINAVVGTAKATFPDDIVEIDRLVAGNAAALALVRREEREAQQARIAAATFFEIWKGELEAGASRSTGSTDTLGLYASANLTRDGIAWRQKFSGRIDYQRTDDVTTTERALVAYQPQYKFDPRLYSYGLIQYEHDQTLGIDHRGTAGLGLGYRAVDRKNLRVDLEGGPAIRRTEFATLGNQTTLAGRASANVRWSLSPTLTFAHSSAVFLEDGNTSLSSTTSLDTKLIGALKARLSYNVQSETDAAGSRGSLDTLTRATLVYSF